MKEKADISKDEVYKYAEEENAKHFYTSAKTGEGLDEIFLYISKEIANTLKNTSSTSKTGGKKLQISKGGSSKNENGGGCCK
jgi:Ras-related protein Rab-21